MCMIHLRHPNHGVKVAYLEAEAVADERNGWTRFNPMEKQYAVRQEEAPEATEEVKPRRGRPRKEQINAAD